MSMYSMDLGAGIRYHADYTPDIVARGLMDAGEDLTAEIDSTETIVA